MDRSDVWRIYMVLKELAFFAKGLWMSFKDANIPMYSLNLGKLNNYYIAY